MKNSKYICQECGSISSKWSGRCENCGTWNKIVEELNRSAGPKGAHADSGVALITESLDKPTVNTEYYPSGIIEFDGVLGGGMVAGATILIAGEPGIGKSTLLLQVVAAMSKNSDNENIFYITGEEATEQIRQRARRLGLNKAGAKVASANDVRNVLTTLEKNPGKIVVIDSIQTMFTPELDSAPGSVSQVRGCAQALIAQSKHQQSTLILLGHVTKEGLIAGPRVLEHMVDTVLTFEGEQGHQFRILRAVKNRFGPTNEIGVFSMSESGLKEVHNPSSLFLSENQEEVSGSVVFAGIEGSRPVLAEIQALVAPSNLGTPRRSVLGWDQGRLAMVLAVLDARCGLSLAKYDVYLNVTGGLRVQEPGMDLAAAAALISSFTEIPIPKRTVVFGEIGLSGGIRSVGQKTTRINEALKLGFQNIWGPVSKDKTEKINLNLIEFSDVSGLVRYIKQNEIKNKIQPLQQKG